MHPIVPTSSGFRYLFPNTFDSSGVTNVFFTPHFTYEVNSRIRVLNEYLSTLQGVKMYSKIKSSGQQRVELNEEILKKMLKRISIGRVSEVADDIGLPYDLVYNLVHGRINSLSTDNYKLIFGEAPPDQAVKRVRGEYFREMVKLWLYHCPRMSYFQGLGEVEN